MSIRHVTIFYAAAFFLQLSVVNLISAGGMAPNLIFCVTIFIAFRFDRGWRCFPFAIAATLLLDLCAGAYLGVSSLALFLVMIFLIWVRYYINTDLLKTLLATGAVCTVLYWIIYWLIQSILKNYYSLGYILRFQPCFIAYNLIIMAILWFFYSSTFRKWKLRGLPDEEEES